jgi:UDP-N-acetylglucosamine--N-acetylmuramyl-(pentapeptide) pyrophosphoryl-undecaprenol N-acetylglucosamine transferase
MIPYPFAAGDHQKANAKALVEKDAALMLEQKYLTGEVLAETVKELIADRTRLLAMAAAAKSLGKSDAAEIVLEVCREIIDQKRAA